MPVSRYEQLMAAGGPQMLPMNNVWDVDHAAVRHVYCGALYCRHRWTVAHSLYIYCTRWGTWNLDQSVAVPGRVAAGMAMLSFLQLFCTCSVVWRVVENTIHTNRPDATIDHCVGSGGVHWALDGRHKCDVCLLTESRTRGIFLRTPR